MMANRLVNASNLLLIGQLFLACACSATTTNYDVWAADQSNTAPGQTGLGVKGGLLWIWNGKAIERLVTFGGKPPKPLPCTPDAEQGPCDILEMFPPDLLSDSTAIRLGDLPGFGRLHGALIDPYNKYAALSMFVPGGGYIGIVDTRTKEAIALFRATRFRLKVAGVDTFGRSVHMNYWTEDGTALIVSNLEGKALERINVVRGDDGEILSLEFDKGATLGLGTDMAVVDASDHATFFTGVNAFGNELIGSVTGTYSLAGLSNLTPQGVCKENGCAGTNGSLGGRPNNAVICPIASKGDRVYTSLTGGGMFVVDPNTSPMRIIGEYGREVVYGAGCAGVESNGKMFINSGVVGSAPGATQSMFALWAFDEEGYPSVSQGQNTPLPDAVFQDPGNTATGGNLVGPLENTSGQKVGVSTRRDSHGATAVTRYYKSYIHITDRIQGNVEVFDANTYERSTYDLTSLTGQTGLTGRPGPCARFSVRDFASTNDPSSDLSATSPNQKFVFFALRGPAPSTFGHSGQGSCPGLGVVKLNLNGKRGRLVTVLPTTNTIPDTFLTVEFPGGTPYSGKERSDVHGVSVVVKNDEDDR